MTFTFISVGIRFQDNVVDELLNTSIIEEASHRLRWVDESGLYVLFVEDILKG